MNKTLRIQTKNIFDFDFLKKKITPEILSKYIIDIYALYDNTLNTSESKFKSLLGFIDYLHENHATPFVNGISPDKISFIKDCSIMGDYEAIKDYGDNLDFLEGSSNNITIVFRPNNFDEAIKDLEVLENLSSKYPYFSFILYLVKIQEKIEELVNAIRLLPKNIQKRTPIIGIGKCFIRDDDEFILFYPCNFHEMYLYDVSTRSIQTLFNKRISELRKSSRCQNCSRNSYCLGITKYSNISEVLPIDIGTSKKYVTNINFFYKKFFLIESNLFNFDILNPNDIVTSEVEILQRRRLSNDFIGPNFYSILDIKSPFYFNRPLKEAELWQKGNKGLPTLNIQFIGKGIPEQEIKSPNDQYISKESIVTLSKILFNENLPLSIKNEINNFTFDALRDIIISNGGNPDLYNQVEQDVFYNGKKFAGKEWKFSNEGYIENSIIICSYKKEKEGFDKRNNNNIRKPLTGITDELPNITKEFLIRELKKRADKFFEEFNERIFSDIGKEDEKLWLNQAISL